MLRAKESFELDRFKAEVKRNPDSAEAHMRLGTALLRVGFAGKAEMELEKAVQLDPKCVKAWINLGGVRLARWDFDGAIDANRKALEESPKLLEAYFNKGVGHLYKGESSEMLACFERVNELDPSRADGQYYMAVALHAVGAVEEAEEYLARSVALGFSPDPKFVKSLERDWKEGKVSLIELEPESARVSRDDARQIVKKKETGNGEV